jgi:putative Ca2+/H+ antiporter (TMEM165/GDT1 family)
MIANFGHMLAGSPFLLSLFFVFAAEMGDKTQLVALSLATRYSAGTVLLGIFGAILLMHLASAGLGDVLGLSVPERWMHVAAGIAFIAFGLWTLRGDGVGEDPGGTRRFGPLMTVGVTFFLAEFGDKTMLLTLTIAGQQRSFLGVWLGSSVGMLAADALAVIAGRALGAKLPERPLRIGAAAIFLLSGAAMVAEAVIRPQH